MMSYCGVGSVTMSQMRCSWMVRTEGMAGGHKNGNISKTVSHNKLKFAQHLSEMCLLTTGGTTTLISALQCHYDVIGIIICILKVHLGS